MIVEMLRVWAWYLVLIRRFEIGQAELINSKAGPCKRRLAPFVTENATRSALIFSRRSDAPRTHLS